MEKLELEIINSLTKVILESALLLFISRLIIKKFIENIFIKKIELTKHELNTSIEELKYRLQIDLLNVKIILEKQHLIYAEMYAKLLSSHGKIRPLFGMLREHLTFEEYNSEDMENYLKNNRVPNGKISEILTLFESDKNNATNETRRYIRMIEFENAKISMSEFSNFFWLNEFYLNENFRTSFNNLRLQMHSLLSDYEIANNFPELRSIETISEKENLIDQNIDSLVSDLRKEFLKKS
ncbi:hypothetical protein [Leptospira bandrabouensis]|uniref:hypothetical protein n=1 Tax=Leptospira bandrabouensis TaxID=2484903 RepID=UPI001EEA3F1F|nr:hypothetical protein [Leptospira bandrabouensis]MCG6154160.1 hypothetical protein [Leptospira bandrabouensis]